MVLRPSNALAIYTPNSAQWSPNEIPNFTVMTMNKRDSRWVSPGPMVDVFTIIAGITTVVTALAVALTSYIR